MFTSLKNKIETLASHDTKENISLEDFLYMCIYANEGAEEINGDQSYLVHNKDEFAISLHGFLGIVKDFLSSKQTSEIVNGLECRTKERVANITTDIDKIEPTLVTISAKISKAKKLEAVLQKKNDELDILQKEEATLQEKIARLNKPELGELDILRKNISNLRGQSDALNKQAVKLTDDLDKQKSLYNERNKFHQSLKKENDDLTQSIQRTNDEIAKLQRKQKELEGELNHLVEAREALNPAEISRKHNELLEEVKILVACWESLKTDALYEQVFKDTNDDNIKEKLQKLNLELRKEIDEFQNDLNGSRKKYGDFLKQWEDKIQNIKESVK
jgi:chromosome segregation ATPase